MLTVHYSMLIRTVN